MMNGGGMGGGVPRVQMPGGPGGDMGGGMGGGAPPPMQGGGMPGGGPGAGGLPPGVNPNDPKQMELLQRIDTMSEQEGAALLGAITSDPLAMQAMRKLVPELGFILDMAGGGAPPPPGMGGGAGMGGPPPPPPGGGMGGMGGAPGGMPGGSRLNNI